jgi:hypothetical protein
MGLLDTCMEGSMMIIPVKQVLREPHLNSDHDDSADIIVIMDGDLHAKLRVARSQLPSLFHAVNAALELFAQRGVEKAPHPEPVR